jgi:hypothetical protein
MKTSHVSTQNIQEVNNQILAQRATILTLMKMIAF